MSVKSKITTIILFLSVSSLCMGQIKSCVLSTSNPENTFNAYAKLLKFEDEDATVIRATTNSDSNNLSGNYLVLLKNGNMHQYGVYNIDKNIEVKHLEVNENNKKIFNPILKELSQLNNDSLNNTILKNGSSLYVNDAITYRIELSNKSQKMFFYTVAPQQYIEAKVKGYRMREFFLDIFTDLEFSKNIITENIDAIKLQDTIFVHFKTGKFQIRERTGSDAGQFYKYSFLVQDNQSFMFSPDNQSIQVYNKNEFETFERNEYHSVSYDFFLKYGAAASFLSRKIIYIIDDTEVDKKSVTKVKAVFLYNKS